MHTYLEAYLDGSGHLDLTSVGKEASFMAKKVIESGQTPVSYTHLTLPTIYAV